MTERKITYALSKISECAKQGSSIEALIRAYLLNVTLIRFILDAVEPAHNLSTARPKKLVHHLLAEIGKNQTLRTTINKPALKALKLWLGKMDHFFKDLKSGNLKNLKGMFNETQKVFGILKISANKINIGNQRQKQVRQGLSRTKSNSVRSNKTSR